MFKKENIVWLYFVGIILMLAVVFAVGKDYVLPIVSGDRTTRVETGFVYKNPPTRTIDLNRDYRATLKTNRGNIVLDLYENAAPNNVNNFVYLANQNYYDGTYFHRLVSDLFLQGGDRNTLNDDPADDGFGGPGYILNDEINWNANGYSDIKRTELTAAGYTSNTKVTSKPLRKYSVAMANSGVNTNGSQFFIMLAADQDTRLQQMDGRYTVIGEVILGRDVLQDIAAIEVDAANPLVPRPIRKVVLYDVEIFTR
jgi:cyclophilin family peptidyl-prolyl cis-trans isomerase